MMQTTLRHVIFSKSVLKWKIEMQTRTRNDDLERQQRRLLLLFNSLFKTIFSSIFFSHSRRFFSWLFLFIQEDFFSWLFSLFKTLFFWFSSSHWRRSFFYSFFLIQDWFLFVQAAQTSHLIERGTKLIQLREREKKDAQILHLTDATRFLIARKFTYNKTQNKKNNRNSNASPSENWTKQKN